MSLVNSLLQLRTFVKCHVGLLLKMRRQHICTLCHLCVNWVTCPVTNHPDFERSHLGSLTIMYLLGSGFMDWRASSKISTFHSYSVNNTLVTERWTVLSRNCHWYGILTAEVHACWYKARTAWTRPRQLLTSYPSFSAWKHILKQCES